MLQASFPHSSVPFHQVCGTSYWPQSHPTTLIYHTRHLLKSIIYKLAFSGGLSATAQGQFYLVCHKWHPSTHNLCLDVDCCPKLSLFLDPFSGLLYASPFDAVEYQNLKVAQHTTSTQYIFYSEVRISQFSRQWIEWFPMKINSTQQHCYSHYRFAEKECLDHIVPR